jgi:hypothetical protein
MWQRHRELTWEWRSPEWRSRRWRGSARRDRVGVVEEVDRRGLSLANDGRRAPADRGFGLHLSGGHLTAPGTAATWERWSSPKLLRYRPNLTKACRRR